MNNEQKVDVKGHEKQSERHENAESSPHNAPIETKTDNQKHAQSQRDQGHRSFRLTGHDQNGKKQEPFTIVDGQKVHKDERPHRQDHLQGRKDSHEAGSEPRTNNDVVSLSKELKESWIGKLQRQLGDAAKRVPDTMKQLGDIIDGFKPIGPAHEIQTTPEQGVINQFHGWLNDPRRQQGEFNAAITKDGAHVMESSGFFGKSGAHVAGYELHLTPGLTQLNLMGHEGKNEIALMHTHPSEPGMDGENFSAPDIAQAQMIQSQHKDSKVHSYLLTPNNVLKVYDPSDRAHPNGQIVGNYRPDGTFEPNKGYKPT